MQRVLTGVATACLVACAAPAVITELGDVQEEPTPEGPSLELVLDDVPHNKPLVSSFRLEDRERWTITRSWTQNGVPTLITTRTIPPERTDPGDVWSLTVTVTDGEVTSTAEATARVTNEAPEVIGARITPGITTASSTLRLAYDRTYDYEGDPVEVSWVWLVDGEETASNQALPASRTVGGETVRARVTASDGIDERVIDVGPVLVEPVKTGVDLVVAVDITSSMHQEYPGLAYALDELAARVGELAGPGDRLGLATFGWAQSYEYTPLRSAIAPWTADNTWAQLRHASRIRGASPDPDDDGLRPHMPREYDGEQGTDPHVGLRMARRMLTERPHDDRFLAVLLVTDGDPLPVKRSEVRERIGYVEDRWPVERGIVPHDSARIELATEAEAEALWEEDRISVYVVSVRDRAAFLARTAQGHGEMVAAPRDADVRRAFIDVVEDMPWGGETP